MQTGVDIPTTYDTQIYSLDIDWINTEYNTSPEIEVRYINVK